MLKRFAACLLALAWALSLSACAGPPAYVALPTAPALGPESALPAQSAAPGGEASDPQDGEEPGSSQAEESAPALDEDGWYSSKDEVALYIHLYGRLPDNYVTKREAQDKGWTGGSVERYTGEGTAIGGSRFGNYEGLLPEAEGRTYTECDIGTVGSSSRGAKRLVFSNDGLVYYTEDHYESFELLYGEP